MFMLKDTIAACDSSMSLVVCAIVNLQVQRFNNLKVGQFMLNMKVGQFMPNLKVGQFMSNFTAGQFMSNLKVGCFGPNLKAGQFISNLKLGHFVQFESRTIYVKFDSRTIYAESENEIIYSQFESRIIYFDNRKDKAKQLSIPYILCFRYVPSATPVLPPVVEHRHHVRHPTHDAFVPDDLRPLHRCDPATQLRSAPRVYGTDCPSAGYHVARVTDCCHACRDNSVDSAT